MATVVLTKKSARSIARRVPPDLAAKITAAAGTEHKYYAETDAAKLELDGIRFDSLLELNRYAELKILSNAGLVWGLLVHPKYPIKIAGCYIGDVELDFEYVNDNDEIIYEDVKGHDNTLSRWKRKTVEAVWNIKVTVIKNAKGKIAE